MRLFGKSKEEKIVEFKAEQSMRNGKELKNLLKIFITNSLIIQLNITKDNCEEGFQLDYFFTLLNNFCLSVLTSPSIPKYF